MPACAQLEGQEAGEHKNTDGSLLHVHAEDPQQQADKAHETRDDHVRPALEYKPAGEQHRHPTQAQGCDQKRLLRTETRQVDAERRA